MRRFFLFLPLAAAALLFSACDRAASPAGPSEVTGPPPVLMTLVDVAVDLADVTAGGTGTDNRPGQSVTIPGEGAYAHLRFNWYHYNPKDTPVAYGTLYLLSQEYLGPPTDLGPSTPGFIARSESIEDGHYVFPASAKVEGGKKYWFYADTRGQYAGSFNTDIYAGGDGYVATMPHLAFRKCQASWKWNGSGYDIPPPGTHTDNNFRLRGGRAAGQ
jgi:hypothetical protein